MFRHHLFEGRHTASAAGSGARNCFYLIGSNRSFAKGGFNFVLSNQVT